jgi:hypothetical protein
MKYAKFALGAEAPRFEATRDDFENATNSKYPFVQTNDIGTVSRYAFCPKCENSVQLIGLYTLTAKKAPYAAHTGKTISGFSKYDAIEYEFCPYAIHRRLANSEKRHAEPTERDKRLYSFLRDNFDKVVGFGEETLGIRFSYKSIQEILAAYIANRGYLYPWASDSNIHVCLFFFGAQHRKLFGQFVKNNGKLYDSIAATCPEANLSLSDKYPGYSRIESGSNRKFFTLSLRFASHKQSIIEQDQDALIDMFTVCVDKGASNANAGREIYRAVAKCDDVALCNHVANLRTRRDEQLLQIAKEIMPELT